MIHQISQMITDYLISQKVIQEDADIYTYGYETVISAIIDFIIVLVGLKNKPCNRITTQKLTTLKKRPNKSTAEEQLDAGCEIKRRYNDIKTEVN